jgi:hypothetical protein
MGFPHRQVLVDITPKPAGERRIAFVPDASYSADFNFDDRPGNQRANVVPRVDKAALATQRLQQMKPSQREYEAKRAISKGLSVQAWLESKISEPLHAAVNDFLGATADAEKHLEETRDIGGGLAVGSKELIQAQTRKVSALRKVEELLLKQRGR